MSGKILCTETAVTLKSLPLLDKLEIASGEYKFPFFVYGDDGPALVEREKEAAT